MRCLLFALSALLLSGCNLIHTTHKPLLHPGSASTQTTEVNYSKPSPSRLVHVYTNAEDLVSKPFRDLGEVRGNDCQSSEQSSSASVNTARKKMQFKASGMKANAVLLHKCEIVSHNKNCYRQVVCYGSALKVTAQ